MKSPCYVQYGCGWCAPAEWENFDASATLWFERLPVVGRFYTKNESRFPENVRYGDIVRGLPIPLKSADAVYCSHVLEHLPRESVPIALRNTLAILKPGGVFRCVVPDLTWRVQEYLANCSAFESPDFLFEKLNMGTRREIELRDLPLMVFGRSAHKWMYNKALMTSLLKDAGFSSVRVCALGDSEDRMFHLVEDAGRFSDNGHAELAMEARRSF